MESLPATRRVGVAAPLSVFRPACMVLSLSLVNQFAMFSRKHSDPHGGSLGAGEPDGGSVVVGRQQTWRLWQSSQYLINCHCQK